MYEFTFDFLLIEVIGECGPSHSRERGEGGRAEGLIVVVLIERERIFSQSSRTHARAASTAGESAIREARVQSTCLPCSAHLSVSPTRIRVCFCEDWT